MGTFGLFGGSGSLPPVYSFFAPSRLTEVRSMLSVVTLEASHGHEMIEFVRELESIIFNGKM